MYSDADSVLYVSQPPVVSDFDSDFDSGFDSGFLYIKYPPKHAIMIMAIKKYMAAA